MVFIHSQLFQTKKQGFFNYHIFPLNTITCNLYVYMYVCIHYIGTAFSGIHTAHIQHFCKNNLDNYKSVIITALPLTPGGLLKLFRIIQGCREV